MDSGRTAIAARRRYGQAGAFHPRRRATLQPRGDAAVMRTGAATAAAEAIRAVAALCRGARRRRAGTRMRRAVHALAGAVDIRALLDRRIASSSVLHARHADG